MKKVTDNVIEKSQIEQATEYPFYATILPFTGKKFNSSVSREEVIESTVLIPGFAMNVNKAILN